MIHVSANSTNEAWQVALREIFMIPTESDSSRYYQDMPTIISIDSPVMEPIHPNFPMKQDDIDIINNYIVSGEQEELVVHEWTKLYHHRMFDEPYSQIEYVIKLLSQEEQRGGCQISMWEKEVDQTGSINPCTQIIWARRKGRALELHVHAHSSDAYKKLLMNIQEFVAVQHFLASRTGLSVGRYIHFIDSCHVYRDDVDAVAQVINQGSWAK
jgi:thymidylate synthase